jgi:hypothetical protein
LPISQLLSINSYGYYSQTIKLFASALIDRQFGN